MNGRIVAGALLLISLGSVSLDAQQATLFPTPLHLTREIDDPISETTATIEEFYEGMRVVRVSGDRTSIADYAEGTITEIDRGAGTYSVATFEELAGAVASIRGGAGVRKTESLPEPRVRPVAPRSLAGRMAETVEATFEEGEIRRIEVSLSPDVLLSREAIEVVAGAAFPNEPTVASAATINLTRRSRPEKGIRSSAADEPVHALPLGQVVEFDLDGERLRVENRVMRISQELPSAELLAIPAGAEKVEHHLIKLDRLSRELDQLPGVEGNRRP